MAAPDRQAVSREHHRRAVAFLRDGSEAFLATRRDAVLNWARAFSLDALPFVTACCRSEVAAAGGPRVDLERLGVALPRFSPRQADLLLVGGTLTRRQAPVLKELYDAMPEPKWVMAFGACTCSGGPYDNYAVVQGIDTIVPVDVYVPGCPPHPEALLDGIAKLQARVRAEQVPAQGRHREIASAART